MPHISSNQFFFSLFFSYSTGTIVHVLSNQATAQKDDCPYIVLVEYHWSILPWFPHSISPTEKHLPLSQILSHTDPTNAFGTFQGATKNCCHRVKQGLPSGTSSI